MFVDFAYLFQYLLRREKPYRISAPFHYGGSTITLNNIPHSHAHIHASHNALYSTPINYTQYVCGESVHLYPPQYSSHTACSGICVYYWTTRYWCTLYALCFFSALLNGYLLAGAIIFTIIALLSIFAYFGYRARIPLASLLLQVVMDVAKHHWSVYTVAFLALFVQAAWSV